MVSYIFQVTAAGSVSRRHAAGHGERKWPSVEVSPRPVDPPFDQVSEVHGHLDGTIFQYENCSPKVIKHATGLFNETSDELISEGLIGQATARACNNKWGTSIP